MLPRKCLTSCEVQYLCAIACPLNERLDQLAISPGDNGDVKIDPSEPLEVEFVDGVKPPADIQTDAVKPSSRPE